MPQETRIALRYFDHRNAGAIFFCGRWIWRDDVRRDAALAAAIVECIAEHGA